jgi:hypothetical protein
VLRIYQDTLYSLDLEVIKIFNIDLICLGCKWYAYDEANLTDLHGNCVKFPGVNIGPCKTKCKFFTKLIELKENT